MSEVIITDPHLQETKPVDSNGRVYFGDDYKGRELKLIVDEVIPPLEENNND